jgi:drug/metabolite transporter (DMT)-like permease
MWFKRCNPPSGRPPLSPLFGISLKLVSGLAFTLMAALIKLMAVRYPVGQLVFFRSSMALIPLLIWLAAIRHLSDAVRTQKPLSHLRRGVIGSTGMFCGFAALSYIPLPDAVAISYATPLIVVVLAALILGETVRIYRWSAVAIGVVGVLLMLSPHLSPGRFAEITSGGPAVGAMYALAGALCSAFATIEVRRLTETETTGAIVFYFMVMTSALGLATLAFGWAWPRDLTDWSLLTMIGVLGGIGQILMTQSFRYAEASLIAPFEYTQMIWAVLLGWFLFGDFPLPIVLVGAAIVIAAGLFVIWREHKRGLLTKKVREASPTMAK